MSDLLFTLRVRLRHGMAVIRAWEAGFQHPNHTRLDAELRHNGKTIFPRGATYCGIPGQFAIDGIDAKECVLSLFCMKPGDTDSEYFDSYTQEQLDWVAENADDLDMIRSIRYCDPETGSIRKAKS